jgi:hypothetical protein
MMNWIEGNWPDRFVHRPARRRFDARAMAYETEELWFDEWEAWRHPYFESPKSSRNGTPSARSKLKTRSSSSPVRTI